MVGGMDSNSAVTVTFAAGMVKLVPLMAWSFVPSLYFKLPVLSRLPVSGVMVSVIVSPSVAVVGEAVIAPPVMTPILIV